MARKSDPGVTRRVDISSGIQASLAGRYALALFELARDEKKLESVGAGLAAVKRALAESEDFRTLATSPLVDRDDAVKAATATADAIGLDPLARNFLGVLAKNRRLAQLPAVIASQEGVAKHVSTPRWSPIALATSTSKPCISAVVRLSAGHFVSEGRVPSVFRKDCGS